MLALLFACVPTLLLASMPYQLCCLRACLVGFASCVFCRVHGCADSVALYVLLDVLHHQSFLLAPLHRWFIRTCVEAGWFTVIPLS